MAYKILLVSPPIFDFYTTSGRREPLGLLYIKEALEQLENVSVEIYDTRNSGKVKKVRRPECFNYLRDIYVEDTSCFSLFFNFYRYGDSYNKIIKKIKTGAHDLVGISSLFSAYHPDVEDLARRIKAETNALVVLGGWALNAGENEFKELKKKTHADILLPGDGDITMPRLVKSLLKESQEESTGTAGSLFLESYPRREKLHTFRGKKIAAVSTSKGCLYRCAFCSIHRNHTFTPRDLRSIEQEIQYLANMGVQIIDFEDDNLFYSRDFTRQLLDLLKHYHQKYGIRYMAMNGITAPNLAPFAEEAIEAGFMEFNLSLVSGSGPLLQKISRPKFREAIEEITAINRGRVDLLVFVIGGLPGASKKELIEDITALAALPVTIGFSPLYLLPGIDIFEDMGIPSERRLLRGSALYRFGPGFSREDIVSIWKYVRMINHLKSITGPMSPEDKENLDYFRKSLAEKRWYHRRKDGSWYSGIPFEIDLPFSELF
ncbi:MAG: radical SAM protein [bacterium]|nr:radical SAM protein [bacterium]